MNLKKSIAFFIENKKGMKREKKGSARMNGKKSNRKKKKKKLNAQCLQNKGIL
jgi:hypothetical protein